MKFTIAFALAWLLSCAFASAIESQSQPRLDARAPQDLQQGEELWKRKGGGRGGGRSGGRTGGSGGGGGRSAPPSGGALGGRSRNGNGPQPSYSNGRFYGGGAAVPYQAGQRSPGGLVAVPFIGVAALAFWPGVWYSPYHVHSYRHDDDYTFFNATANETQTKPIMCGCADEFPCSCDTPEDEDDRDEWLDSLVGNGSYDALNKSIIDVGEHEDRSTIFLNGTLPYDTVLMDPDASAAGMRAMLEALGWWPMGVAAMAAVFVV